MPKDKKPTTDIVLTASFDVTEMAAKEGITTLTYVATEDECSVNSLCFRPDGGKHWCVWTQIDGERLFLHRANFTHLGEWFFLIKQNDATVKYLKVTSMHFFQKSLV